MIETMGSNQILNPTPFWNLKHSQRFQPWTIVKILKSRKVSNPLQLEFGI